MGAERRKRRTTAAATLAPSVAVGGTRGTDEQGPRGQHGQVADLQRRIGNEGIAALAGGASVPAALQHPGVGVVQRKAIDATSARVRKLLSYGAFDWAITDAEATEALHALAASPDCATITEGLGPTFLTRLDENLPPALRQTADFARVFTSCAAGGPVIARLADDPTFDRCVRSCHLGAGMPPGERAFLQAALDATPDGQVERIKRICAQRFGHSFRRAFDQDGGQKGKQWDAKGLRAMFGALTQLPEAHVAGNTMISSMGALTTDGGAHGDYDPISRDIRIGYAPDRLSEHEDNPGKAVHGMNSFDETVRHEVGHAVDAALGWSTSADATNRLGWKQYKKDTLSMVLDVIADTKGAVSKLPKKQKLAVAAMAARAVEAGEVCSSWVEDMRWLKAQPEKVQDAVCGDYAWVVLDAGSAKKSSEPWNHANSDFKHVYHDAGSAAASDWVRYDTSIRSMEVSNYQRRSPYEWFAEAYAVFYEPGTNGSRLNGDPKMKEYMEKTVAGMKPGR